jgi:hypothetical protein
VRTSTVPEDLNQEVAKERSILENMNTGPMSPQIYEFIASEEI